MYIDFLLDLIRTPKLEVFPDEIVSLVELDIYVVSLLIRLLALHVSVLNAHKSTVRMRRKLGRRVQQR